MKYNTAAFSMVSSRIQETAKKVSDYLKDCGVSHALVGGMAVSTYSRARATEDVDFLVPSDSLDCIQKLGKTRPLSGVEGVTVVVDGVTVDFIFAPSYVPEGAYKGVSLGGVPVLHPGALVLMKMHAPRIKDHADVIEMLKGGLIDQKSVRQYIKKNDPSMLEDFDSNVMLAEHEKTMTTRRVAFR